MMQSYKTNINKYTRVIQNIKGASLRFTKRSIIHHRTCIDCKCIYKAVDYSISIAQNASDIGIAEGGGGGGRASFLYLNDLLPQIVDLVVLTLGKYQTKAGNKAILIADPARARR